jgi:hypothetical protein
VHIDSFSLALLLAIGVLSYLLGYLCSKCNFLAVPTRIKTRASGRKIQPENPESAQASRRAA